MNLLIDLFKKIGSIWENIYRRSGNTEIAESTGLPMTLWIVIVKLRSNFN